MIYDFDTLKSRRGTGNAKWDYFDEDVLPLWVADMDFPTAAPILDALHQRVNEGTFGYEFEAPALKTVIVERLLRLYDWEVTPEQITFLPGIIGGFNAAIRAAGQPGDGVLMLTPAYMPFLSAPANYGQINDIALMTRTRDRHLLRYEIDFDAMQAAITPRTRTFLMCNPHNPLGRVYQRWELERLAQIAQQHDLIICSDEIHSDLIFDGHRHIPVASLSPEIAARTITLMSPSKTFNLPGLALGFAVITNPDLMTSFKAATAGISGHISVMGYTAALAAYRDSQSWLDQVLDYLQANRDFLEDYVGQNLPGVAITRLEGTYLAWLDYNDLNLPDNPAQLCLDKARVALIDGEMFGAGGEGCARLNFACPRSMLADALERIRSAFVVAG